MLLSLPMDLTNSTVKTSEPESRTPTRIAPPAYTNGVLKRHAPLSLHPPVVVSYKECLKNHAAALGGHALDGCGEFMPSPASNPTDPTSLKCAACGCHRNFHRREPEDPLGLPALEYRSQHHRANNSPNHSPSPPPISSSYYPSAPHVLLALGHVPPDGNPQIGNPTPFSNSSGRKRFRTKFTQNQKEKMLEFADRIQWKMQKRDEDLINQFCGEIGVDRGVFKVWMHNNKNNFGKKDSLSSPLPPPPAINGNGMRYSGITAEQFRQEEEAEEDCEEKEEVVEGQQLIQNHVMVGNGSG